VYNFCTLFNSKYLKKGLVLYNSLTKVCKTFHLYVYAFDDEVFDVLNKLKLPFLTVISLSEFENEKLLNIKGSRNLAEYCWTCGPSTIWYSIKNFDLDNCTYLDADMLFFNSVDSLFNEIGSASVALTEHMHGNEQSLGGRFCVQFVYFKNDSSGMAALKWWRNSCIDWCFARFEDGKYGDQKYLDEFPNRFNNVHIIESRGAGVAPWNVRQYKLLEKGLFRFNNEYIPIIFFHYHGVRVKYENKELILKPITYDLNFEMEKYIYFPFLEAMKFISINFLGISVEKISIKKRSYIKKKYSLLKRKFQKNRLAQFLYYKVIGNKYNGYEK